MDFHLYLLCNRFEALIASQLDAEAFGQYMAVGRLHQTTGEEIFFEIDPGHAADSFNIDRARQECVPHPDGGPRRSKYVSIYRAMEKLPMAAFGRLYLATRDGRVLARESKEYTRNGDTGCSMFAELCPSSPLVVTLMQPPEFIKFATDLNNPIGMPKIFLADMLIDQEPDGRLASYLPYQHPSHIVECIREVTENPTKKTKVVDRRPQLPSFFRTIRRGFFLGDQHGMKVYPFPTQDQMEEKHHLWWRSALMG